MEKLKSKSLQHMKLSEKKKYGVFLKRKRIENKMTLEELANGVCTASYLSRIENNLVDVSEDYYSLLFKKLNVDYYSLKEIKEHPIFNEIISYYLNRKLDESIKLIDSTINESYYVSIEYDLMVLYESIIKGLFNEVVNTMKDIDAKIDTLQEDEISFYLFLTILYFYRSNQFSLASREIKKLINSHLISREANYSLYDLALDVFYKTKELPSFYKIYNELMTLDYVTMYQDASIYHKMEYLILTHDDELNNNVKDILLLNSEITSGSDLVLEFLFNNRLDYHSFITKSYYSYIIELIDALRNGNGIMVSKINKEIEQCEFYDYNIYYKMIIDALLAIYYEDYSTSAKCFKDAIFKLVTEVGDSFLISLCLEIVTKTISYSSKYKEYSKLIAWIYDTYGKKL